MRAPVLIALVIGVITIWNLSDHAFGSDLEKPVSVTRIYTGADGQTHAEQLAVNLKSTPNRFGQPRGESELMKVASSQFIRFPAGYVQDWHPAAARRYLVTLSGRGEVELVNGQKISLAPGQVLQAEDITGKGHITRTVGKSDWVALFVQFDQ